MDEVDEVGDLEAPGHYQRSGSNEDTDNDSLLPISAVDICDDLEAPPSSSTPARTRSIEVTLPEGRHTYAARAKHAEVQDKDVTNTEEESITEGPAQNLKHKHKHKHNSFDDDDDDDDDLHDGASVMTATTAHAMSHKWLTYGGACFVLVLLAVVVGTVVPTMMMMQDKKSNPASTVGGATATATDESIDLRDNFEMQDGGHTNQADTTPQLPEYNAGGNGHVDAPSTSTTTTTTTTTTVTEHGSELEENTVTANHEDDSFMKDYDWPTELPLGPSLKPIQAFSSNIVQGYAALEDLQLDVANVAHHMLNRIILQNMYDYFVIGHTEDDDYNDDDQQDDATLPLNRRAQAQKQQPRPTTTTSSSSKTNNQERSVDEADSVKNDDTYTYAAMGDYLVVWNHLTGIQADAVPMPALEYADDTAEEGELWDGEASTTSPNVIHAIVLTPNHVVVLVDASLKDLANQQLFHQATQILIYTKPTDVNDNKLQLVATQILPGLYRDGRWLEASQSLHLVVSGDINLEANLIQPLALDSPYMQEHNVTTPWEYVKVATALSSQQLIPQFVDSLSQVLRPNSMLQINAWGSHSNDESDNDDEAILEWLRTGRENGLPPPSALFRQNFDAPFRSFVSMVSIHAENMPAQTTTVGKKSYTLISQPILPMAVSSFLAPTPECHVYSAAAESDGKDSDNNNKDHHLVMALVHYQYNETINYSAEQLFLIHATLVEQTTASTPVTTTNFSSVATFPGRILGSSSLDIQGNDLRVATTTEVWVAPNTTVIGNHVVVLDITTPGDLQERGRVQIGSGGGEEVTAVRFGPEFSYITTALVNQDDGELNSVDGGMFYVVKVEAAQAPEMTTGSFQLRSGYVQYLHPLINQDDANADDAGTLLVGVGHNTDSGTEGVMITIFNVADENAPSVISSRRIVRESGLESYTDAEWDAKAVQYANGKLVLPVQIYDTVGQTDDQSGNLDATTSGGNDFEGFVVFQVGASGIEESFRISNHFLQKDTCQYCNGDLPSRSILLDDGSLMTMSAGTITSTSISSNQEVWTLNVTLDGAPLDCCW